MPNDECRTSKENGDEPVQAFASAPHELSAPEDVPVEQGQGTSAETEDEEVFETPAETAEEAAEVAEMRAGPVVIEPTGTDPEPVERAEAAAEEPSSNTQAESLDTANHGDEALN